MSIEIALQKYGADKVVKNNWILVKEGDYYVKLLIHSIDYFEAEGNYLLAYCDNKPYKCRSTTKQMLQLLPEGLFVQIHRAYIANKSKIAKFNSANVIVGNATLPVSGKYTDAVLL